MSNRKLADMTEADFRSAVQYGVFTGGLGLVALATILLLTIRFLLEMR